MNVEAFPRSPKRIPPKAIIDKAVAAYCDATDAVIEACATYEEEIPPSQCFLAIAIAMSAVLKDMSEDFAKEGARLQLQLAVVNFIRDQLIKEETKP